MSDYNLTWELAEHMAGPHYYRMLSKRDFAVTTVPAYRAQVDRWMKKHNCGEWVHQYMVRFDTAEQATLFLLRWL